MTHYKGEPRRDIHKVHSCCLWIGPNQICSLILPKTRNIELLCYKYLFHDLNHSSGSVRSVQQSSKYASKHVFQIWVLRFNVDAFGARFENARSCLFFATWPCSSGQTKMPCCAKPTLTVFGPCGPAYLYMLKQIRGAAVRAAIRAAIKICSGKSQPLFSRNTFLCIYNRPSLYPDPRERQKEGVWRETTYADVFQTRNMSDAKRHLLNCRCVFP